LDIVRRKSMDGKEDRIRQLAHKFWLEEGQPEGRATEHWHRARRHIEANGTASPEGKQAPDDTLTLDGTPPPQKASPAKRVAKAPSAAPKIKKTPQTRARRPVSDAPKDAK